jgi:hypothetical protein
LLHIPRTKPGGYVLAIKTYNTAPGEVLAQVAEGDRAESRLNADAVCGTFGLDTRNFNSVMLAVRG